MQRSQRASTKSASTSPAAGAEPSLSTASKLAVEQQVRAKFDYVNTSGKPNFLSFRAGDRFTLLREGTADWCVLVAVTSTSSLLPSLLRPLQPLSSTTSPNHHLPPPPTPPNQVGSAGGGKRAGRLHPHHLRRASRCAPAARARWRRRSGQHAAGGAL